MINGFIDTLRPQGHAVESVCAVLREQGCQVAARTYRAWRSQCPAARTISDALVVEAIRQVAWTSTTNTQGQRRRVVTPEGPYGRRKMTAHLRRLGLVPATPGAVDRGMRLLGLVGVRRDKGVRTTIPAKDGIRAGNFQFGYMSSHFAVEEDLAIAASLTGATAGVADSSDNAAVSLGYGFAERYPGAFTADQFYAYLTSPSSILTLTAAGRIRKGVS